MLMVIFIDWVECWEIKGKHFRRFYFFLLIFFCRYFICCKNRSARCKARANCDLTSNSWELVVTQPHNHPKDLGEKAAIEFMEQLKLVCKSGIDLSPKDIYKDVAKLYVSENFNLDY